MPRLVICDWHQDSPGIYTRPVLHFSTIYQYVCKPVVSTPPFINQTAHMIYFSRISFFIIITVVFNYWKYYVFQCFLLYMLFCHILLKSTHILTFGLFTSLPIPVIYSLNNQCTHIRVNLIKLLAAKY